ncbi:Os10g0371200 [Oryza sativa Japonica Group]|uniref:Os10g0371200 protein n=1 Tax=Oryza sativa subsp. japonica TaxID=39947 RepID=C7J7Y1_ORYSJ|nr:Os10g0371200 [Oryza sativa Japonica Group]|eukprot:NP_001176120.1 Os10g0371200 [Oryza sativa Japonica Group]
MHDDNEVCTRAGRQQALETLATQSRHGDGGQDRWMDGCSIRMCSNESQDVLFVLFSLHDLSTQSISIGNSCLFFFEEA